MSASCANHFATTLPPTCQKHTGKHLGNPSRVNIIKDGYSKGEFIHISLHDDHLSLKNGGKQILRIYYYQDDLVDRVLAEARTRYHKKLAKLNRAELIADIYVSLNQKDLQYLASYYGIEPDGGGNYDYSDIINTLMAEKVKHLERCRKVGPHLW